MALINHAKKEVNTKLVFFGPPSCGKGDALAFIYSRIKPALRGDLRSVPAGSDNLLLFDFSPFDAPLPHGYRIRLHIYTLTGPVTNPATWRMTLKGADGIMIMVDSAPDQLGSAKESISQLRDFLSAYGVGLHETPAVLLCNSTVGMLCNSSDQAFIAERLELTALPCSSATTTTGEGLLDALAQLSRLVLDRISVTHEPDDVPPPPDCEDDETELEQHATAAHVPAEFPMELPNPDVTVGTPAYDGQCVTIPLAITVADTVRNLVISVKISEA